MARFRNKKNKTILYTTNQLKKEQLRKSTDYEEIKGLTNAKNDSNKGEEETPKK